MLVFTDGSHSLKPRMSGLGAVIISGDKEHHIGAYNDECRDNNVAELAAIAMSIKFIRKHKLDEAEDCKTINIISDSSYALRKITQNGMPKDEYEKKILDYIHNFINLSKKRVSFMQVKGHIHDGSKLSTYNNLADIIAGDYRLLGLELYRANPHCKGNKKGKKKWKKFKSTTFFNDGR